MDDARRGRTGGRPSLLTRIADALLPPTIQGGPWVRLARITYVVRVGIGLVALAVTPVLPGATPRQRGLLAILLAAVYLPYAVTLSVVARRRSGPGVRLATVCGDLLIVFMFQALLPPTRVVTLLGHVLITAFYTTLGGLRTGVFVGTAAMALTLTSVALTPPAVRLDAYTLSIFGAVLGALAVVLHAATQELRFIVEQGADATVVVDGDGIVRFANAAAERLLGLPADRLNGRPFPLPLRRGTREVDVERPGGEVRVAEALVTEMETGDQTLYVATLRDVTDRVRAQEDLRRLALHDELTGLYNRRGFLTLGRHHALLARRNQTPLTLLFVDVDNMKAINDTHGHGVGDRALVDTAGILVETFRESDVIARVGGDEFCVLLSAGVEESDGAPIDRLNRTLERHNARGGRRHTLSLTIGVARAEAGRPISVEELMERADRSMYAHKPRRPDSRR